MATEKTAHSEHGKHNPIVLWLEKGDGWAHLLVSGLLLTLAIGILVASTVGFVAEFTKNPSLQGFDHKALDYLNDLLMGVIVLELLSTILTYIQARKLEATIKDFLIVGIISSVRKILLVGAQSSLEKPDMEGFVKESYGTVITVVGIIALVGGLLLLDRRSKASEETPADFPAE